jgi:ubiquinone/menaquinone biosynthesis C-methylase UbiE
MRVLDVGCGAGKPPVRARVAPGDVLIGVDVNAKVLCSARVLFPRRVFLCCQAESLPFADSSFDRVVSSVALPYTNIPRSLAEIRRVLTSEGTVFLSVHHLGFTLHELYSAGPRPVAILFRLFVIANGLIFHVSGKTAEFVNGRRESFQTKRGMTIAMKRAGFRDIVFSRDGRLIVEAKVCSTTRRALTVVVPRVPAA